MFRDSVLPARGILAPKLLLFAEVRDPTLGNFFGREGSTVVVLVTAASASGAAVHHVGFGSVGSFHRGLTNWGAGMLDP